MLSEQLLYSHHVSLHSFLDTAAKPPCQGFPGGSVVKNRLPMQEIWLRSLVWEDPTCTEQRSLGTTITELVL